VKGGARVVKRGVNKGGRMCEWKELLFAAEGLDAEEKELEAI
jgi:hypothetical protein